VPHGEGDLDGLVGAALASGAPIDVTSQPALWGGRMRGTEATLTCIGNSAFEDANDENHATDVVQAHLIETLSCIGREYWDIYYLRIRRAVEEYQLSGALQALELAKQEGHIRHIGLCCDGPSLAVLGAWQFHDAFETLLVPRNHYDTEAYDTLSPLAKERRVGVVTSKPLNWGYGLPFVDLAAQWRLQNLTEGLYGPSLGQAVVGEFAQQHPVMVGVRTVEEVQLAVEAPNVARPEGLAALLEPYVNAFESEEEWASLLTSDQPALRAAAQRRQRDQF